MRENERDFHYSMDATLKKYLDRKRKLAAGTSSAKTTAEKKTQKGVTCLFGVLSSGVLIIQVLKQNNQPGLSNFILKQILKLI